MNRETKTSLNIGAGLNVKAITAAMREAKETRRVVGVLYGAAFDTITRANPVDPEHPFNGFSGQFEFVPAADDGTAIDTELLFLPDALREKIAGPLDREMYPPRIGENGQEVPNDRKRRRKVNIVFAYRQSIVLDADGKGFKWDFDWVQQPVLHDPFAAIKAKVAAEAGAQAQAPEIIPDKAPTKPTETAARTARR